MHLLCTKNNYIYANFWTHANFAVFSSRPVLQARIQAVAKVARATVRFFPFCINLFEDIRLNILRYTLYSYNNKNLGNFMSYFF